MSILVKISLGIYIQSLTLNIITLKQLLTEILKTNST